MTFNSPEYALLLLAVVAVYYRLGLRAQNALLLAASYLFYGFWDERFLALICASTYVDFASGKETARIEHPAIPGVEAHTDGLQTAPAHGLAVTPDGKSLWSTSKVYGYAYVHSLPDLKEIGRVFVGQHPEWLTLTPDGKLIYVAAAGDNMVFVIDVESRKEVARIPVGQVPKRNATALLQSR